MGSVLWGLVVILVVLWLIGLVVHITFAAIHLLLVAAVILVIWNLLSGRRRAL
jgi:hypothetical protein